MVSVLVISKDTSIGTLASAVEEFGGEVETATRMVLPPTPLGEVLSQGEGSHTIIEATCTTDVQGFMMMVSSAHLGSRVYDPSFSRRIRGCLFSAHHQADEDQLVVDLSTALVRSARA